MSYLNASVNLALCLCGLGILFSAIYSVCGRDAVQLSLFALLCSLFGTSPIANVIFLVAFCYRAQHCAEKYKMASFNHLLSMNKKT